MSNGFPILPFYEVFYIHSMLFNSTSAVQSLVDLSDPLEAVARNPTQRPPGFDDNDVLNHLQNVVLQAAAVSKYCFPPRQGHEARADTIKVAIGITDGSPLKNRDLRNALEHFDERLDAYLSNGVVGQFFPQYVGPELKCGQVPSFSSTSEVSAYLPMIGLNVADFRDLYPYLTELMTRRHEIVHTADLDRHDAPEPRALVADDAAALEVYSSTVTAFVARMLSRLDAPERINSHEHLAFVAKAEEELAERIEMRRALAAVMANERK